MSFKTETLPSFHGDGVCYYPLPAMVNPKSRLTTSLGLRMGCIKLDLVANAKADEMNYHD